MRHKIRRIHFVGIGGAGMCGLAEVMHSLGYAVSGSDSHEQSSLARLRAVGVRVYIGQAAEQVADADCVVYSGAIAAANPERQAAVKRGVPVIPRAQMLGEVLRFKRGVAVAGTHGKTTVSSMLAAILTAAELDPTCIIGGRFLDGGGNARIGAGGLVVVEADESDASFLHLQPQMAVITNIDNDHLSAFGGDIKQLQESFYNFLGNLPFYGAVAICLDDPGAAALAARVAAVRVIGYGLTAAAEVRGEDITAVAAGMHFILRLPDNKAPVRLQAAGLHNVQNALGACAIAHELGVGVAAMTAGLEAFSGVGRRLENHGEIAVEKGSVLLLDDYAHHPTEITATLAAVRGAYPQRRLTLVFQPHRYTRTRDVFTAMVEALCQADALILLAVYPAGEQLLPGADSAALAAALRRYGKPLAAADSLAAAAGLLRQMAEDGDVVVTMGAGDVGVLPQLLKEAA